jgi:CPA1 family monovalent cation:H+ antiporter
VLRRTLDSVSDWLPPYQVVLAAAGIAIALIPGLPRVHVHADLILQLFVPALVFEAALNLNLAALRRVLVPVAILATAGVAITIGLIAVMAHFAIGLTWPAALLLGAVLSPTDPIAVVAVIRRSGAPAPLATLLEGESLFNDGTGVAAFTAIAAAIAGGHVSAPGIAGTFLVLAGAGFAIGAVIGVAGSAFARLTESTVLEVGITLIVAYGSYALATAAGASGVIAVVAAGLAMARVGGWGRLTERSWSRIAIVLNALLFTLIGLGLPLQDIVHAALAVGLGFVILIGARLVTVYALVFRIPHRWRQLLWWGGVRGALSVALALAAAERDTTVPVIAYGVIALSLVLQGSVVRPVVSVLRLRETR